LEQGEHHFTFTPGPENFYILTVKANNYQKSIKMINDPFHSSGSECKLNYTGKKSVIPQHKSSSGKSDFVFTPGDLLIYTGYADSTERKISDRPMDDQYYVFQFNGEPCPETPYVWDIDGNVYNTVKIFGQCWMKENLKTTTYSYGMPVINATDSVWATTTAGAYAWYNNDPGLSYAYGALYNGYAVGGLCPEGWSVPTVQQFEAMKNHIQGTSSNTVAQYLKACRQKNYAWGMCNADTHPRWEESIAHHGVDTYGFSGMPGGARFPDGSFDQVGFYCYWWTSSTWGYDQVFWYMIYSQDPLHFYQYGRNHGFSIRCIKNTEETE